MTESISQWRSFTHANPHKQISLCVGDFNFAHPRDRVFQPLNLEGVSELEVGDLVHSGTRHHAWRNILCDWTEISQPLPSYFNPRGPSLKRLDRAWVDIPANLLSKVKMQCEILIPPGSLFAAGLSDHSPLSRSCGIKSLSGVQCSLFLSLWLNTFFSRLIL